MKHRGSNIFLSVDFQLVFLYSLLVFIGWLNIYSAVYDETHQSIFSVSQRYGKQLIWIGIAYFAIIIPILASSYKIWPVLAYFFYGGVILMLVSVLIFGTVTNGARSWFEFSDSFKIQPSEFAKFATALALSKVMSAYDFDIKKPGNFFSACLILIIPALLIFLQPDMGSVIVFFSLIFVFYREGMSGVFLGLVAVAIILFVSTLKNDPFVVLVGILVFTALCYVFTGRRFIEAVAGSGVIFVLYAVLWCVNHFVLSDKFPVDYILIVTVFALFPVMAVLAYVKKIKQLYLVILFVGIAFAMVFSVDFVFDKILSEHQQTLINVFLGIEVDPQGTGYNVEQSKIAIGSGGFSGKGFLQGTQTKYNFVPEQATDFIFCTVGEEWGFMGTFVVVGLFIWLILRILYLAELQRSSFARIYGYCVSSILFFHLAVNIGMTIGLVPVIGIPLPFFSYGGSSLWSFTILLFIFIRMDASRDEML